MVVAFMLGLAGSLGHCLGMCGGVTLLLSRGGGLSGWRLPLVHMGRIITYGTLGLLVGALGGAVGWALPGLRPLQGALALAAAGVTLYLALALLGRAPSPETYLVRLTARWGQAMQRLTTSEESNKGDRPVALTFLLGLLWGLLPCGLVLTALLTAAVTGSPWRGALTMLAFGLGTSPALLGMGWLARRELPRTRVWPRQLAALVVLLFGVQMALRGLAAWGWVNHLRLAGVMLW